MSGDDTRSDDSIRRVFRYFAAFVLAPLAVPLLLLPWLLYGKLALRWVLTSMVIGALVSYTGTLVFGMPVFFLFRRLGYKSVWVAVIVGFSIGAVMWLVFFVLASLSWDPSLSWD